MRRMKIVLSCIVHAVYLQRVQASVSETMQISESPAHQNTPGTEHAIPAVQILAEVNQNALKTIAMLLLATRSATSFNSHQSRAFNTVVKPKGLQWPQRRRQVGLSTVMSTAQPLKEEGLVQQDLKSQSGVGDNGIGPLAALGATGSATEAEHWPGRLNGMPPPSPQVVLKDAPPFVVLPGFGNAAVDYISPLGQPEEVGLAAALQRRGVNLVEVVPIDRSNWLNVLRGVLDINFLKGDAQPDGPAFDWYLQLARATVEGAVEALQQESSDIDARVVLLGHSAGGWLARALCLDEEWAKKHVRGIVSVGAPQLGPPPDVPDQVRGTVTNLNLRAPGAHLPAPFFYVTVASGRIMGTLDAPPGSAEKTAYNSYQMVCGDGAVAGDGIVPLSSAHLDGATQITLDCFHSIAEPGTAKPTDNWYAAEPVIDQWLGAVANELRWQRVRELLPV